ncbi:MAG: hypothetical protein AABZ31_00320 [Bdellovibrionota bacterium]
MLTAILILQIGCAADSSFEGAQEILQDNTGQGTPTTPPDDTVPPPDFAYDKLAWEDGSDEKLKWSYTTLELIISSTMSLKSGAKDATDFCPQYSKINDEQKAGFWAYLISAIAKYETDFSITKRTVHESGATDPVTQLPRYREGLMHVSYADSQVSQGCQFDWTADRDLLPNNSKKSIFDPFKNIKCGIHLLDAQIAATGKISVDKGGYWNSLNPNSKTKKVKEIQALTKALSFCK